MTAQHRDEARGAQGAPANRRRRRFVRPRLQLRLIGGFAGIALLALLLQFTLIASGLFSMVRSLPTGSEYVLATLPGILGQALLLSFLLLLPAVILVGLSLTFPVAGPLVRFEQYLAGVVERDPEAPCKLRDGDELQDLCASINAALEATRRRRALPPGENTGENDGEAGAEERPREAA